MLNLSQKLKRQTGITLIETMIGLALSMIVVTSMVSLMGNSLGSATRIIQMTQLSDELRNTMSMLTRDVRRANYNANSYKCYANSDCGTDGIGLNIGEITVDGTDCLIFNLDRDQDGSTNSYRAGGFRLADDGTGVGYIEMWVGDAAATPACGDNFGAANWIALTDSRFVDITTFFIDGSNSLTASLTEEGGGTLNQRTRRINVQIVGELITDDTITRTMEDTIKVRNDYIWKSGP